MPSSFLRRGENETSTGYVYISKDSSTGAYGFSAFYNYLESVKEYNAKALAEGNEKNIIDLSSLESRKLFNTGKTAKLIERLKGIKNRIIAYNDGVHDERKKNILYMLELHIKVQISALIGESKVTKYYNNKYYQCHRACAILTSYAEKKSSVATEVLNEKKRQVLIAIENYLNSLPVQIDQGSKDHLSVLVTLLKKHKNALEYSSPYEIANLFIQKIDGTFNGDFLRGVCKPPTIMAHELLKVASEKNSEHVSLVRNNNMTLGASGDIIHDLSAILLAALKDFTIADDLRTNVFLEVAQCLTSIKPNELPLVNNTNSQKLPNQTISVAQQLTQSSIIITDPNKKEEEDNNTKEKGSTSSIQLH